MYIWLIPAMITLAVSVWFLTYASPYVWNKEPLALSGATAPHKITAKSLLPLIVIIAVYTPVAFWQLGSTETPQSFASFEDGPLTLRHTGQAVSAHTNVEIYYYSGLGTGDYTLDASEDGVNWSFVATLEQNWVALFKWHKVELTDFPEDATYIRISASNSEMELGEVYITDFFQTMISSSRDPKSYRIKLTALDADSAALIDEPGLISNPDDWMHNSYFDEIYHPRTAYEHIRQLSPYEVTHPPLGKIILSLGIRMFGMNPFGWRFIGTLFGILMLIPFYFFAQNMFGKTLISASATTLFAVEFMHYTHTRIGTVDTEAVFFILLMYYFMYRYFISPVVEPHAENAPYGEKAASDKSMLWLFLSGAAFGLGAATKWIVIYGGLGLAWLWGVKMFRIIKAKQTSEALLTTAASIVFFIVVPVAIYLASYIPYAQAKYGASADGTFGGYLKMIWENQKYMMGYHGKLDATHPYSSPWYSWLIDLRPILYFQWFNPDGIAGTKSVFGAFTNPVIAWTGLGAIVFMVPLALKGNKAAHLIFAGWVAQLLPWIFIPRIAFAYHYFPNIVFLILAIAAVMNSALERPADEYRRSWAKPVIIGFTAYAAALFILFFPALSGLRMTDNYSQLVRWFNGNYPF
ncbi:MAG: phospholipid carrier-dependent glycosyltransferase [Oscillospiraceae bacterium]|jgi:4-amino-4-deoxy-L-arabinose transferase-like glycosyltransferase|nr:phospholipid carrier-dependent glycosyltransferase [Oscillospiraceae bacterium]